MITSFFLGTIIGLVMGLTGAGGSILAVPLLMFTLPLTVVQAGPVGLFAVSTSAAVSTYFGLKAKLVRYRATLLIASSGILLAPFGVWLAHRLDTQLISLAFAGVLGWVAYKTLHEIFQQNIKLQFENKPPCVRNDVSGRFIWTKKCARALSLSGAIAGILSGLLGVGGGFVMVPALQRYTDLSMQSVIATSLAVISIVSLTGVVASLAIGNIDLTLALPFSAGSIAGIGLASLVKRHLAQKYAKAAFGLTCLVVAIVMLIKSF